MAYTGTTAGILSNYDEVLKTFYLPAVQEQLNQENLLSDILRINEEDVSGKSFTVECHYGRTKGTGSRADGGALPEADYQKYKTCTVPMKYHYGRITVSGPTIAATRDERGAYVNALTSEIEGVTRDLLKERNRQLWGSGYGILARWRSTASGTSYTLQKKYRGNSAGGDFFGSTFGAKYLSENASAVPVVLTVSSGITAVTVDTSDVAVSAITEGTDYDTVTVTDPSVTEAAGTFYVRPASLVSLTSASAAGAARLEMMGLRGIITDTDIDDAAVANGTYTGFKSASAPTADTLQGLAVGTYSWWKSQIDSHASGRYAGQRALTFNLMQKMFDKIEDRAGKDKGPNIIITSKAIRREFLDLCYASRKTVNTMDFKGGGNVWTGVEFNGVPITADPDAIDGEMYFLTLEDLAFFRMSDWDWMSKDGSILSRITGYDAYEAVIYQYAEMGCKRRNTQGVITDIAYEA